MEREERAERLVRGAGYSTSRHSCVQGCQIGYCRRVVAILAVFNTETLSEYETIALVCIALRSLFTVPLLSIA